MFEDIRAIQKTNQQTSLILNKLKKSYAFRDINEAFVLLRATLKALRDRITPDEALHLGSQLTPLLRGFYFEGFDLPQGKFPKSVGRDAYDFLSDVSFHLNGHDQIELEKAVPAALEVILDSIDQGEAIQVLHQLPKDIKEMTAE